MHDALAALPLPARQEGSGVITGGVRTEDGTPVPGVVITAVSDERGRPPRAEKSVTSPESGFEGEVLGLVERRRWAEATRREARTDSRGEYRLERLAAIRYAPEATLDGYEFRPAPGEKAQGAKPGDNVGLVATPSVSVPVVVLLPEGTQPESARIEFTRQGLHGGSPKHADWTPAAHTIRLEPGDYSLAAVYGEEGELRSDLVDVALRAGEPSLPITLELRERPGLRGRVLFTDGEAMNTNVFVLRHDATQAPDYQQFLAGRNGREARLKDRYRYFFRDLLPGRYMLAATRLEGRVEATVPVEVSDRLVTQDIELLSLDPAEYIVVWARGPRGKLLTDVDLNVGCRSEDGSSSGTASWLRRPDGSYWVVHYGSGHCADRSKDLRYTVAVTSRLLSRKEAEYTLPRDEPVVVAFTEPAFLDLVITGYEASGHEVFIHAELAETRRDEQGKVARGRSHSPSRALDSGGWARFGPLEPGDYELTWMLNAYHGRGSSSGTSLPTNPVSITLRPGENTEPVPLPGLHSLTVAVESPRPDTRLNLRQLADEGAYGSIQINNETLGEDGRATFRRLPAGRYSLSTASGYSGGEMVVQVPEQVAVRYDPQPRDAMRVYISDSGGVLARAGFKTGDLVVGLDGTAFTDEPQMQATMKSVALKEEVKLRVLRNNETLELSFDSRLHGKSDRLGGHLWASCR